MNLAYMIIEQAIQHKDVIKKGAMVGGGVVIGAAGMHVVDKKKADKVIQEEKKISFEHGVKTGKEITVEKMRKTFIDPLLARVALAFYIAQVDGSVSKEEKNRLTYLTEGVMENKELPDIVKNEVKKISRDKNLDFDKVKKYLDKVDTENLESFMKDVYDIATASAGINYDEENAISQLEEYILSRYEGMTEEHKNNKYDKDSIDIYCDNFVSDKEVREVVEQYGLKMKILDHCILRS